jgi:hypothetical protein
LGSVPLELVLGVGTVEHGDLALAGREDVEVIRSVVGRHVDVRVLALTGTEDVVDDLLSDAGDDPLAA